MPRKIGIVGTASSGREAPYRDSSFEIWGVSARADYVVRADRWYELHRLDGEPPEWAASWRKTLSGFIEDIPLYMLYPEPNLAKTVLPYPHNEIVSRFGTYFMTSTFAWMFAHAIQELRPTRFTKGKGDEIFLCGVDMEAGTEYAQQRAGLRHFIHVAGELGIAVTRLGEGGQSYEPIPYPMWQDDPLLCKLEWRKKQTSDRLAVLDKSIRANRETTSYTQGELSVWQNLSDVETRDTQCATLDKRLVDLNSASAGISVEIAQLEGRADEIQWALDYLQP